MIRRICEQIFHDAGRQLAGLLVLFKDDSDLGSGRDIFALAMRHFRKVRVQAIAFP